MSGIPPPPVPPDARASARVSAGTPNRAPAAGAGRLRGLRAALLAVLGVLALLLCGQVVGLGTADAALGAEVRGRLQAAAAAGAALALAALGLGVVLARAERRHAARLQAEAEVLRRKALVAERTDNAVVVTDRDGAITWVNPAFVRLTGASQQAVRGHSALPLLQGEGDDDMRLDRVVQAVAAGRGIRQEVMRHAQDGSERWLDVDIQPLPDEDGRSGGFVGVATDVTERRRLQEQLRTSARTDPLTGLPNRSVVLDRVQRAIDHAAHHPGYGYAVLFMDVDRFKHVNDSLGHAAGDELLRQIAQRIEGTLRPGDAVGRVEPGPHCAARVGGDEFVVVLEGVRAEDDARTVSRRLLEELGRPYRIGEQLVQSGASIGFVTAENAAGTADEVLRDADTALYAAKRAGRGRCVGFDSTMQQRLRQALALERELRASLERPGDALVLLYQPMVSLADGGLVGIEALLRWRHPTLGLLGPEAFVPAAEDAGLMEAVGREVLESACAQWAEWRRVLGPAAPRRLALNLAPAQLRAPALAGQVAALLRRHAMGPGELELEITERMAAHDEAASLNVLAALRALGVRIVLDDFGAGSSSLASLQRLAVDGVKIDRGLVQQAEHAEVPRVLIEATVRVARSLRIATLAEGVETPSQAALLRELHCELAQGWLFARPLEPEALPGWVAAREAPALAA